MLLPSRLAAAATLLLVAAACSPDDSLPRPSLPNLAGARAASGDLLDVPVTFKFDNFNDVGPLQLNNAAAAVGGSLRITDSVGSSAGSFFSRQKISLKNDRSFSTYFRMRMTDSSSPPADGIVFILQPNSNNAGGIGQGIGYEGITNSVGIEFDTYSNPALGDPNDRHIGTHTNGVMTSHLATASWPNNFANGSTYHVWIDYNGLTNLLEVRVNEGNQTRPASATLTQTLELSSTFGVDEVYAGFTAATGGSWSKHWIDFWYFQNDYAPIDTQNNTYAATPTSVVVGGSPTSNTRSSTITATVRNSDGSTRASWPVTLTTTHGTLDATSGTTDANGVFQTTLNYAGNPAVTARVGVTADGGAYGFVDVALLGNPTLTTSAGAGGTVSPSGVTYVPVGTDRTVTITPNAGYYVTNVLVNGVSVGAVTSYDFTNVTSNQTLSATFAIYTYAITVAAGPHGSISPSGNQTVNHGSNLGFTITPAAFYEVADVLVDGASVGAVTSYAFNNVTAPHSISVSFQLIDIPPTLTVSGGSAQWVEESPGVVVDPTLQLTDPDGPNLTGARVAITSGFLAAEDRLEFTSQGGISGSYDTNTGVLTLTGSASVAAYEAAFRTVTYRGVSPSTPSVGTRSVTFSLGSSSLANPDNGHYYEFVAVTGIPWTTARVAAQGRNYYGLQGYLVTVTSAAENAFISSKLVGSGWMGAADDAVENTWRWVTGPEGLEAGGAGRHFWSQAPCSGGRAGSAVGGSYDRWASCEPNQAGNEDYAHFYSDGSWNDYPNSVGSIAGYVVEYGGMPNDEVTVISGTRDVEVVALPLYTIAASAGANGSIAPSGNVPVKQGHAQLFTFTPDANHHVDDVLVDGVSVGAPEDYTFTNVVAAHTIEVAFMVNSHEVRGYGDGHGDVTCPSPVLHNTPGTCTIHPGAGYELIALTDNGVDSLSLVVGNQYVIPTVVEAHAVRATFIASRGTVCVTGSECGSGICADGVCCNATCDGQCESCTLAGSRGTCAPVTGAPVGKAACASDGSACGGACDGIDTAACVYPTASCRAAGCTNGVETEAASCDGAGACPAAVTDACDGFACGATACETVCASDAQCADGFFCSSGACVPELARGATCTENNQCGTGRCVDGVCCNAACNGQCEACDIAGREGTCSAVTGAPHGDRMACADEGEGCGGTCGGASRTACVFPGAQTTCRGASCAAGTATLAATCDGQGGCPDVQTQACGAFGCDATTCQGDCSDDSECASGNWCSAHVCVPHLTAGLACGADNQCGTGHCVDGVCCNTSCEGQCEACDVLGASGVCVPVTGAPHAGRELCGSDGSTCGGTCNGVDATACAYPTASTQCRAPGCDDGVATLAAACDGQGACPIEQTVSCGRFSCGDTVCLGDCAEDTDCGAGNYCASGVCTAQLAKGDTCATDNQCGTGQCVDGVCCDKACDGQCEACDRAGALGTCGAVSGAPHGSRDACQSDGSLCGGTCNGFYPRACSYPTVECRAASCADGTATLAASCSAGSCPAVQTQSCGQNACGATACSNGCTQSTDCASGSYCAAGVCVALEAQGDSCATDAQCGTGHCVDGVCCNAACDGQCEACDVAGSEGSCVAVSGAPHGARETCAGDGSLCNGVCDGQDRVACAFPSAVVQCASASCTNDMETRAATCDGAGACEGATTRLCGEFGCGATACAAECLSDADCGEGGVCAAGQCQITTARGCASTGTGGSAWLTLVVIAVGLALTARPRRYRMYRERSSSFATSARRSRT